MTIFPDLKWSEQRMNNFWCFFFGSHQRRIFVYRKTSRKMVKLGKEGVGSRWGTDGCYTKRPQQ